MTKIREVISDIEKFAPLSYQESYDNAGLMVGNANEELTGALICLDITEAVMQEAKTKHCNLIIAHHPLIFGGLKKITGKNLVERCVIDAIKNDIALYACHTNVDATSNGVSFRMAEKLRLNEIQVLSPMKGELRKLVTFVPATHAEKVRNALFNAGAGHIGNYDSCSYNLEGDGTFRAGENTNPYVGEKGSVHFERETRIETVFPNSKKGSILSALFSAHPYEEVAYDIYPIENTYNQAGMGAIGKLVKPVSSIDFLSILKDTFKCGGIRHTELVKEKIETVAMCGGAGSFLLNAAISKHADIFISGDFKYHDFFNAEKKIIIADIGHYESEQFTKDIFYEILMKKNPKFAVFKSEVITNPIKYY